MRRRGLKPPAPEQLANDPDGRRADSSALPTNWVDWQQALRQSQQHLSLLLQTENWAALPQEIQTREKLLRRFLTRQNLARLSPEERHELKDLLDEFLSLNSTCLDALLSRRQILGEKIGEIKVGRKTLKLYKTQRVVQPRFIDRFG